MLAHNQDMGNNAPKGRILVVDDDPEFAAGLSTFLLLEGYEVESAESENKALAAIAAFEADIAILDYRLGTTIGLDLVKPLMNRRPELICLLATAHSDLETAIKAMRHSVADYFCKPLNTDELLATLDRCFESKRLRREKEIAEAALGEAKKLEAVAQLASGVAHNSNNLLMVILGNAERLKLEMARDKSALALIDDIERSVVEAADLNWGLLSFARQQILRPRPCDLPMLVGEALAVVEHSSQKIVTIELDWEDGLWPVYADQEQLRTAVGHLLRNSLEAMPEGGTITLFARNKTGEAVQDVATCQLTRRDYVMLSIADSGHGMPAAIVERAFDPFFSGSRLNEKIGLGLSIVAGFARQSGGNVELESAKGKGTTVRLFLPRAMPGKV